MRKSVDFGNASTNCFDFEQPIRYLYCKDEVGDGGIEAFPVFLVDPCQNGSQPLRTATIISSSIGDSAAFLSVLQARYQRRDNATAGVLSLNKTNAETFDFNNYGFHGTSAVNTALTFSFDIKGLNQILALNATANAGTFTYELEGSMDNFATQDVIVDNLAAAASFTKNYTPTTVGTTLAVSPLAFRFQRVTLGAAGVGNTTTLEIGVK